MLHARGGEIDFDALAVLEEEDSKGSSLGSKSMSSTDTRGRDPGPLLVRHEGHTPRERSACGWRDRLISHEDTALYPAAWAHAVDIDGAKSTTTSVPPSFTTY